MIKEIRIQPRNSGKTTWARDKAEELNGFYIDAYSRGPRNIDFTLLPRKSKKLIVIDNIFFAPIDYIRKIMHYKDVYDFILIGTITTQLSDRNYPKEFITYLKDYHPELLI